MTKYVVVNKQRVQGFTKGKCYEVKAERESPVSKIGLQYLVSDNNDVEGWLHHSHCEVVCISPETRKTSNKISSDGGSTAYYDLPTYAKTLYDIIDHFNMNFSEGNVFKAVYRMGRKEGVDQLYDWNKIKFCAEREIARLEKLNATGKE